MSITSAPFLREPRAVRPIRFTALLLLAVAVTLLNGLLLLSLSPTLYEAFQQPSASRPDSGDPWLAGWLTLAIIVLVPMTLLWALWHFRLRSWWWVGGGWIAVAPVLVYLTVDDPVARYPLSVDEIAPSFPDAEKSFEVLMRYGKKRPAALAFKAPDNSKWTGADPDKPAAFREFLLQNRAQLEADWAALAPQRAWWAELNAFERLGDLTPLRADAEIPTFSVFRAISQRGCAFAALQALDGRGEEAIETLLPILQVARKLQPSSRTLIRLMIGVVMERLVLRNATWILDTTTVSPAARARLASALRGSAGPTGARRLVVLDFFVVQYELLNSPIGDLASLAGDPTLFRVPLNLISPFVYNRRATANLCGDFVHELGDLAARRDTKGFERRQTEFFQSEASPHFKNFFGFVLLNATIPSYTKIVDAYWKTEDMRTALLARVSG